MSARRLRTLGDGPEDERLATATLDWVARQRRRQASPRPSTRTNGKAQPLFRGLSTRVREPDPTVLAQGLIRATLKPSGKSREPNLMAPINFAFRLRHLLGVGARAESLRFLLTTDAQSVNVATVTSSAGYAKRNVHEALGALHAAGVVTLTTFGSEQRYGTDRDRWAQLLETDVSALPVHRDWPQLFSALRTILRWLDRPELPGLSDYLRASQARDLLDDIAPKLARAGVIVPDQIGGQTAWEAFTATLEQMLSSLDPGRTEPGRSASFDVYPNASGNHRWRLNAANGRIIAASAESFASPDAAERAARAAREVALSAVGP